MVVMTSPDISHNADRQRYELKLDGEAVGKADYRDSGEQRIFTHTVIEPGNEGQGYATKLIDFAIADTREAGRRIVGECSMVAHWLTKHPELAEFVDAPAA
jgi:predicted GNAT family acetyltransferase